MPVGSGLIQGARVLHVSSRSVSCVTISSTLDGT